MNVGEYYNGNNLLSQEDKSGNVPGIYMSNTNRSAGKTSFYQLLLLESFLKYGEQFALISRTKAEMEAPETMFENIIDTYYRGSILHSKNYVKGVVKAIYLDKKICGFAVCLKDRTKIKRYSSIFANVWNILFDEMQSEDGKYLDDEVEAFESVIASIGRGGGSQMRDIRVYMCSNNISIMNPYFLNFEIYKYITDNMQYDGDAVYVKGNGWVAEFDFNEAAAEAMANNSVLSSFNTGYKSVTESVSFLVKSSSFIEEHISGKSEYLYTLIYKKKHIGVRKYPSKGLIYMTESYDPSCKSIVALSDADHDELTIQLRNNTFYFKIIRDAYTIGKLRFQTLGIKDVMIKLLGVDYYRKGGKK